LKTAARFIFVLLACVHLCGGARGLMQCVAWAGMLVSYSQKSTVVEAVEKTFDGAHPCALCRAIQKTEPKKDAPAAPLRLPPGSELLKMCQDMLPLEQISAVPPLLLENRESAPGGEDVTARRRNAAPAAPPPRCAGLV
jgi:hypothetical protein